MPDARLAPSISYISYAWASSGKVFRRGDPLWSPYQPNHHQMLFLSGCEVPRSYVIGCMFPAPLVQRPSTSAFQAGDHGFESRTGYQSSFIRTVGIFAPIRVSQGGIDEPRRYRGDGDPQDHYKCPRAPTQKIVQKIVDPLRQRRVDRLRVVHVHRVARIEFDYG